MSEKINLLCAMRIRKAMQNKQTKMLNAYASAQKTWEESMGPDYTSTGGKSASTLVSEIEKIEDDIKTLSISIQEANAKGPEVTLIELNSLKSKKTLYESILSDAKDFHAYSRKMLSDSTYTLAKMATDLSVVDITEKISNLEKEIFMKESELGSENASLKIDVDESILKSYM